jgi:hypothetical protein
MLFAPVETSTSCATPVAFVLQTLIEAEVHIPLEPSVAKQ